MKKKIVSLVVALAMIVCLAPGVAGVAKAGQYDYPLTFDAQGGTIDSTGKTKLTVSLSQSNYVAGGECAKHTAYKSGYIFLGWYTAKNSGTFVGKNYVGAPSTVYAHYAKITASSTSFGSYGSSVNIVIDAPYGGHDWCIDKITANSGSWTSWISIETITNGYRIKASSNMTFFSRYITVVLKDRVTGKTSQAIKITQSFVPSENRSEYYTINNQFVVRKPDGYPSYEKYRNLAQPGQQVTYDFQYASWFWKPDANGQNGGCCTDSAMMDMLNRRLARDNKLRANYFFDIRDVIRGIAVNVLEKTEYDNVRIGVRPGDPADYRYWSPQLYGVPAGRGSERINAGSGCSSATFTNEFGSHTGSTTTYNVRIERNVNETRIRELLKNHPEGIFVYANKSGGGAHAFLVVGINASGNFIFIDNGSNAYGGTVAFGSMNGYSPASNVFSHIISIAYVQ